MIADAESLPDDIALLKAIVLEGRRELAAKDAELARSQDANTRLWETLRQLQRAQFGRKSEKLHPDQFNFGMEETEQALAEARRMLTVPRQRRKRRSARSIAAHCQPICRGKRSSSNRRTNPVHAVARPCM